jgi:hypothetical protein
VLVADQIGNPVVDPLRLDTVRYGNAKTYVTKDVVDWARTPLHVLQDAAHWTVAGYSNGWGMPAVVQRIPARQGVSTAWLDQTTR